MEIPQNLKCPKCGYKGYVTKMKQGDEVIQNFCCSYCFYDMNKENPQEKKIEFKIKKEEELLDVLRVVKRELQKHDAQTSIMKEVLRKIEEIGL